MADWRYLNFLLLTQIQGAALSWDETELSYRNSSFRFESSVSRRLKAETRNSFSFYTACPQACGHKNARSVLPRAEINGHWGKGRSDGDAGELHRHCDYHGRIPMLSTYPIFFSFFLTLQHASLLFKEGHMSMAWSWFKSGEPALRTTDYRDFKDNSSQYMV